MFTSSFRVLHLDATTGKGTVLEFGDKRQVIGGSGLAAALFDAYAVKDAPWDDPRQPVIFAIGPLTGLFPLMSKVVCGFKSPYHNQFAESHAGGRLALALRFAGYDALMITGRSENLCVFELGSRRMVKHDVGYLRGAQAFETGKYLRRFGASSRGHRSILRVGPAGENGVSYACINVDTYRHFGRLGSGAALGRKNVKAVVVLGDGSFPLPDAKAYNKLFKGVYEELTATDMMSKYHDLGTAVNLKVLNELKALPWRNLQATQDDNIDALSGETFAEQLLLRQTACSGCPVGCIHIGLLRQMFAKDHEFLYRQVNYDYEPIFAEGTMLGIENAGDVLAIMDESEKMGLDVMSTGVALAWATEAVEKGVISEKETLVPLSFGNTESYLKAVVHLGERTNEFYHRLGTGALNCAEHYGGEDYACVLGQEMAGYATGEVFYVAEALGFRHSHLDSGGYSYDQANHEKDAQKAVKFLVDDEKNRVILTSAVSCLFARKAYSNAKLKECLAVVGYEEVADALETAGETAQKLRWKLKFETGFVPEKVKIPKRFTEVVTWKGPLDVAYMNTIRSGYEAAITDLAQGAD